MMRAPRTAVGLLLFVSACAAACAQASPSLTPSTPEPPSQDNVTSDPASPSAPTAEAPQWKSRVVSDPGQESYTELSLQGTYVVPPSNVAAQPALIVQCANGKVLGNFFSFGAVLSQHVGGLYRVELQARIDGVRRPIGVDELSPDGTAAYFSRDDLRRILWARQVEVRAVEFAGPQMQAAFSIPDSSPIYDACGREKVLKEHWVQKK
jgi:hypothetical protein